MTTDNNSIARAKQAIADNEENAEELTVLISTIADLSTKQAEWHKQIEDIQKQSKASGIQMSEAYEKLDSLLPVNPLGNMTIGAV